MSKVDCVFDEIGGQLYYFGKSILRYVYPFLQTLDVYILQINKQPHTTLLNFSLANLEAAESIKFSLHLWKVTMESALFVNRN